MRFGMTQTRPQGMDGDGLLMALYSALATAGLTVLLNLLVA